VNGCAGGWRALCGSGAAGGAAGDALRIYEAQRCARAPVALYWLPRQPHLVPRGALPGLNGSMADLFLAFFASAEAQSGGGKAAAVVDVTPLPRAGGSRVAPCAAPPPAAARREARGGGPCAQQGDAPPWPLNGLLS
jgi:hypothetical protein